MAEVSARPNESSEFAPPRSNVSITAYSTFFICSTIKQWTAHGVVTLVSILANLLGIYAMDSNGASFTSDFSSVYRVAYRALLDITITSEDIDGSEPLLERLV
ncbi:hypothetical protein F5Y15DRAFT_417591 [Xylariaceae sp. FL0016]|nr:hypothetical protein F5Y15DRAFT_417591 [Xylariaceae sp. FL0016]